MKNFLFILTIFFLGTSKVFGQADSIKSIDQTVNQINTDSTLTIKEFDATEVYDQAFDGGGTIKVYFDVNGIKKIDQQIGVSFGRITTMVYFKNEQPIKIIDREENFKWKEDQTGWDYSELNQVFQADIYVFDWEMDKNKTIKHGKRKVSNGTCSLFEYEPLITLGKKLTKKDTLYSATGDLDKDGIEERVIVFDTGDTVDNYYVIREIVIYKKSGDDWVQWKSSKNAIKKDGEGGMMGDPFEDIKIDKGILIIRHSGGSSWKWFSTDKYRYQNGEFELIGFTHMYGKPCNYFLYIDYNLSTGKMILKKEYEKCENGNQETSKKENETFYKKGLNLNLSNRYLKDIKVVSPKYKHEIYL